MKLKLLKRNKVYQGRVFNVIVDDVEYPSGNKSVREVAEHIGGGKAVADCEASAEVLYKQLIKYNHREASPIGVRRA